ncbi:MAG: outer membrane beta-barrel protein, partial [Bacteroidales bacterium]
MKHIGTWTCLFLLILCNSVSYSQKIATGIFSGVNFSDIRGQDFGGKWESKPGPVQGFQIGYSFGKCIGIQTGINFSTVYYQHKTFYYPDVFFEPSFSNYYISPVYYNQTVENMDFSFLRIPLLFTVSIPSAILFNMKAGVFFSFMQDHSLSNNYYSYSEPDITKKNDFGYMFSSGISYPLSDKFKAAFNV